MVDVTKMKVGLVSLGAALAVLIGAVVLVVACTGSEAQGGLDGARLLTPSAGAAGPAGMVVAAVAPEVIDGMERRLDEVRAQVAEERRLRLESGQRDPGERKLSWQEIAYVGLGGLGLFGAAVKKSSADQNRKLQELASGVGKAMLAHKAGAGTSDIVSILTDHIPVGVDVSRDEVASAGAAFSKPT